jgi:putative ABC transport system substrate-binding protein
VESKEIGGRSATRTLTVTTCRTGHRCRAAAATLLLVAVGLAIVAAQAPVKAYRIAILAFPAQPVAQTVAGVASFRRRLAALGWIEGRNVVIEERHVEREQLDEAAARIVRERVDLIVAVTIPAGLAAKKATATIPIVMATSADPVGSGLVESLARPGGNVTGLSFAGHELPGKRLELLGQMVPRLAHVGAVYPQRSMQVPFVSQWIAETERAARALALTLQRVPAPHPADWDATFAAAKRDGVRGLTLVESPDFLAEASLIAAAALRHRLPTVFGGRAHVDAGGLMAYGDSASDQRWARAAAYVDKILRGTKPADLPVEQSTTFDLVINAKTAKVLALAIPSALRLQAAEILE